jgi:hypothetical protein
VAVAAEECKKRPNLISHRDNMQQYEYDDEAQQSLVQFIIRRSHKQYAAAAITKLY